MAGPTTEGLARADLGDRPAKVLIVCAPYYRSVADMLLAGAREEVEAWGATHETVQVPGALEIAPAIAIAARLGDFQAFVALGCVIRGETSHYDTVCEESARGLTSLGLQAQPVGNGILTDLMVHWLDVAHWILNVDHPEKAVAIGDHYTARDVWQTPDTIQTLLLYRNNLQMHFEGTFCNARAGSMIEFMGTEGTLYIDRGRFELIPEQRFPKNKPEEMILNKDLPRGRDFYPNPDGELLHLQNWIDAIRNQRQPSAPISAGVSAAAAAHLGNEAYRHNRVATSPK